MTDSRRASRTGQLVREGLSNLLLSFFDLCELIFLSVVFEMGLSGNASDRQMDSRLAFGHSLSGCHHPVPFVIYLVTLQF